MFRSRPRSLTCVVAGALTLGLSACSGLSGPDPRSRSTDVPFASCSSIACTGSIDGAAYEIVLPSTWNGTLLLYSHGYRTAQPAPPDFAPVETRPEPAPGWSAGQTSVGQALLAQGYALAGSAYASNGWAVADGVRADEDLYAFFRDQVGQPNRVYAWGDSLGGLITAELAERHPDWVSGSAPLCGALAGLVPNMDLALDVGYAVRELIWPAFKVTGYTSYEDAVTQFEGAAKRIVAAARDVKGGGTAKVLFVAALVDAPTATRTYDGSTIGSRVKVATEGVLTALGFGTYGRYDVEQRLGGNPSTNVSTEYSKRFTAADQRVVDAVAPGATARFALALARGKRIEADPGARSRASGLGDPQGDVQTPMVTMHTMDDPLVLVQNESWYAARAADSGDSRNLVQLVTVPPATFPETTGAPYGAGHCTFTLDSRVGVVRVLDDWVRLGIYPGAVSVSTALGAGSGFVPDARIPAWPLGGDQPTAG